MNADEQGGQTLAQAMRLIDLPRVLLAEDDFEMRALLTTTLVKAGFEVIPVEDGRQLQDYFDRTAPESYPFPRPDVVVTDVRMPTRSGLECLAALRAIDPEIPVILITGFGDEETHESARRLGATAVLDKPFDLDELVAIIEASLR